MAQISSQEIEEFKEKLKVDIKKYGSYLTSQDLYVILKSCPTASIKSATNKILRKRKEGRGTIDIWLDTYLTNYYKEKGELPKSELIIELLTKYYQIPFILKKDINGIEKKVVPQSIKKIIERVRKRVYMRIRNKKVKHKEEAIDNVNYALEMWKAGEISENFLIEIWKEEKKWIPLNDRKLLVEKLTEEGISPFLL